MKSQYDTVVIGGGAAGFFAAIHAASRPGSVAILEKSAKLLAKVLVSGGGRCNVTHDCRKPAALAKHYPRGGEVLKSAFATFGPNETITWFEARGVKLKTEADGRMFPVTDSSATVANCLLHEAGRMGVEIFTRTEVKALDVNENGTFRITTAAGDTAICRKAIVTTGGFSKPESYGFISRLGIRVAHPVPSLFTFNVPDSDLNDLMGLSVPHGWVQIPGTGWKQEGPVLITHWGFSAPAVIKLSAWAAVELHQRQYQFPILINWTGQSEEKVRNTLQAMRNTHPGKTVLTNPCMDVPARLWSRLCEKASCPKSLRYADLPAKTLNRLVELLVRSPYHVSGKTTWKEEFVTCGGVELDEINIKTFESVKYPGLYFAGEVLHADGITGGFNFQHAWTSGYLAGTHAARSF